MFKIIQRACFRYSVAPTKAEAEIKSVPGHKPPTFEDTVQGKYAGVLFSIASQREALHLVLQDMKYLKELADKSPVFAGFLLNSAYKRNQQRNVIQALTKEGFHEVTQNLLNSMIDSQRIFYLTKTADKFIEYYRIFNKEENITIISAENLSEEQRSQVIQALKESSPNMQFSVQYKVDASILGGLQMYSGNKFLDCSLLSRVNKLRSELQKLSI
ncbi:unnamed protein product (macronuclear) [Paramecium tetraurelia]|uniref:Uncharacterized protein n=1 Tax=Paramecium tetraurelia TaxID=5888 RepID=A0C0R2_PARTE|nr:uncharacterized protein GSPATT00033855001 [Paramecium tetraurelia]CAK64379.1 unnamed protein product [Paramecium tetraurelia]|eukprot:XP_001431777.1 hypothetical protein (macronuclear) [Paramecium tetraurelia strain d4-2]